MFDPALMGNMTDLMGEMGKMGTLPPPPSPQPSGRLRLSAERERELSQWLVEAIQQAQEHGGRQALLQKLRKWNQNYEGITSPKNFPWPNAANVFAPITLRSVRGVTVRLNQSVLKSEPLIFAQAVHSDNQGEVDAAKKKEAWMHLKLLELLRAHEEDSLALDLSAATPLFGTAFTELGWRTEEDLRRGYVPGEDDYYLVTEQQKKAGAYLDFVPIEDLVVIPATARSLGEAMGLLRRRWVRRDALVRGEKAGIYHNVDRVKVADEPTPETSPVATSADTISAQGAIEPLPRGGDRFQILEGSWKCDIDGDGVEETLLVTIALPDGILLRCEYYPYLYVYPSYQRWRIIVRPNKLYGMSIAGMVEAINDEVNTIRNQRLDAITLTNVPIIKRRRGSFTGTGDSRDLLLYPGAWVEVEAMDDIEPMNMGQINPAIFTEESIDLQYVEDMTGITSMKLGRPATGRRTWGEISNVMSESNVPVEDMIASYSNTLVTLAYQIEGLYRQFRDQAQALDEDLSFLDVPVRYIANGSLSASNKSLEQQKQLQLAGIMMQSPLVMADNTGQRLWAVTRDLLNAFDVREPESYIGPEPQKQASEGMAGGVPMGMASQNPLTQAQQFIASRTMTQSMGGVPGDEGGY